MKIDSCPKCNRKGSLIFTTTKRNGKKYSYIQHYDPKTKAKKKCSIPIKELVQIKFNAHWYQVYKSLITIIQIMCDAYIKDLVGSTRELHIRIYGLNAVAAYHRSILEAVGCILEENGYLKYRISERIMWDVIDPEPGNREQVWKDICAYDFVNNRKLKELDNAERIQLPQEDTSIITDILKLLSEQKS